MDLRSKRIVGIAQMILLAAMLVLYTRIGGMGMIYVAGSMELFFVVTYLFLGGIPDTMEYMIRIRRKREQDKDAANVWKAGAIYGVFAIVLAEIALVLVNELLVGRTDLLYVDKLLELLMLAVPFLGVLQVLRGIVQAEFDKMMTGISQLVFVICMVIGTVVSGFILGEYGAKVANLMQSVGLEHFYVVIGLVPGVIIGAVGAIIFLAVISLAHREQMTIFDCEPGVAKESLPKLCMELFASQAAEVVVPCLKHVPILVLLWLSLGEIAGENYLFGNFYGAVLPVFGLAWTLLDLGLVSYKRRLYIAYRKKQHEQFYRDLKTILCYTALHSVAIFAFTLALHKSYLAIWDLQTFTSFMELAMVSSVIGLLGLPCMVLEDVLKYRGLQSQVVVSVLAGTIIGIIGSIICFKYAGAGTMLYVLGIGLQLAATIIVAAWHVSSVVGIYYMSVLIRTGASLVLSLVIALVLYGVQRLIFTALGGLATLLICILIGAVLQNLAIIALHVFDKDEQGNLPLAFLTKGLTKFF